MINTVIVEIFLSRGLLTKLEGLYILLVVTQGNEEYIASPSTERPSAVSGEHLKERFLRLKGQSNERML